MQRAVSGATGRGQSFRQLRPSHHLHPLHPLHPLHLLHLLHPLQLFPPRPLPLPRLRALTAAWAGRPADAGALPDRRGRRSARPIDPLVTDRRSRRPSSCSASGLRARYPDHCDRRRGVRRRPAVVGVRAGSSIPIDGTDTFVRGVPFYRRAAGARARTRCQSSVSRYFPALDEMVAAARGLGCRWNGRLARVSAVTIAERRVRCLH